MKRKEKANNSQIVYESQPRKNKGKAGLIILGIIVLFIIIGVIAGNTGNNSSTATQTPPAAAEPEVSMSEEQPPTDQNLEPKEQVLKIVNDKFGANDEWNSVMEGEEEKILLITAMGHDLALSKSLIANGMLISISDSLQEIGNIEKYNDWEVSFVVVYTFIDVSGNENVQTAIAADFTPKTRANINWDNLQYTNIPNIWDSGSLHPVIADALK